MTTRHLTTSLVLLTFALYCTPFLSAQALDERLVTETTGLEQQIAAENTAAADRAKERQRSADERTRRIAVLQDRANQNHATTESHLATMATAAAGANDAYVAALDARTGTAILKSKDGATMRLEKLVGRTHGAGSSQVQVIAFSALDAGKRAEMTEDLYVMTKLIDDAVADQRDGSTPRAMGINVTTLFGEGSSPRSLYVEGHGAIFQATVRFPLIPTEKKDTTSPSTPIRSSAWEEARKDLYGGPEEESELWYGRMDGKAEEYSEERIEALKKNLLKALSNANNFRHLGRDETITAVVRSSSVQGRRVAGPVVIPRPATPGSGSFGTTFNSYGNSTGISTGSRHGEWAGGGDEQTMTIRVKKSDADSLANGRITEDEFRKRATIAVY